jgi:hypothetical protein
VTAWTQLEHFRSIFVTTSRDPRGQPSRDCHNWRM